MTPQDRQRKEQMTQIGGFVANMLRDFIGHSPDFPQFEEELRNGNLDSAKTLIKKIRQYEKQHSPASGLANALKSSHGNASAAYLQGLLAQGDYSAALGHIEGIAIRDYQRNNTSLVTTLQHDPRFAAQMLCGSVLSYHGEKESQHALIARASAWNSIGGNDQSSIREAPGTITIYRSKQMGGFDVALINAHPSEKQGAVSIDELIPFDTRIRARIKGKTEIAHEWGFAQTDGKHVLHAPLSIQLRRTETVLLLDKAYAVTEEVQGNERSPCSYTLREC